MTHSGYEGTPPDYEYSNFNFAAWTTGTTVSLHNVPWTSDYRDVVEFDSESALDDYLSTNGAFPAYPVKTAVQYVRQGHPIRLEIPFNIAYRYNYLRAHNPAQTGIGGDYPRSFYYFVQDVRYISPSVSEFIIQLDVWQSFRRRVQFGNAYVARGHVGIADTNSMYDNGRVMLTQPEGLDIGGEYAVEAVYRKHYGSALEGSEGFDILVTSTTDLAHPGTSNDPKLATSTGSTFENLPNGAALYWFDNLAEFKRAMNFLSNYSWVTQGIVSIQAIPPNMIYTTDTTAVPVDGSNGLVLREVNKSIYTGASGNGAAVTLGANFRNDIKQAKLGGRYRNLQKFLTYPYCVVELTTYTGTPLILKPENIGSNDISCYILTHLAQPSPRIMFVPRAYNKGHGAPEPGYESGLGSADDGGEFMDMMTGFFNFPTFSIANNGYISYAASNKHSIAYQHSAADWSQQKALAGNQTSYDQASAGMELSNTMNSLNNAQSLNMTGLANVTARQHLATNAVSSMATGAVNGALMGPIGMVAGLAGAAVGQVANVANTAIDENSRNTGANIGVASNNARNAASVNNSAYVRDTNKSLADWAAKGDYANTIAGINAKVQDARMTQPTTSGQLGGEAFNLAVHGWVLAAKVKMLTGGPMRGVGEYWLRYGYAINRFVDLGAVPLSVMDNFTYWQCREVYIAAAGVPELFRQTFRGILEKGVTVWKNPNHIGNLDIANNNPVKGVYINVSE